MTTQTWRRMGGMLLLAAMALPLGCENYSPMRRQWGDNAMQAGDVAGAQVEYTRATELDPSDWKNQMAMGQVYAVQKRWIDSELAFEKAYSLRPNGDETPDILDGIAEAIFQQERIGDLQLMLAKATHDYGTTRDYLRQGSYLAKAKLVDEAWLAYRKAAQFAADDDISPYMAMADFAESLSDKDVAADSLRRALGIRPKDPKIASRLRHYGIVPGPSAELPRLKVATDMP
ncbi:MAG: hypothetical protein IT440_14035 [Phycisphaeraceae bacterium]|nr:hypothetical protein [Phycisphaeraceae bacterium]